MALIARKFECGRAIEAKSSTSSMLTVLNITCVYFTDRARKYVSRGEQIALERQKAREPVVEKPKPRTGAERNRRKKAAAAAAAAAAARWSGNNAEYASQQAVT